MRKTVIEKKRAYIVRLKLLLTVDERSGVEDVKYSTDGVEEFVTIVYEGGHSVVLNVTGNSCGAILKEVAYAVY